MATNTGSNGGKNNPGSGVMRGPGNVDQSQGIGSALNQAAYRREYNEKMFSDNGFLQSSIKDLQKQADELDRLLKTSEKLTKVEQNRYTKMANDMRKLAAEQDEMYKKQEASSKELQSSLNKSANARLKSVDELYQAYMKKEKELGDVGKRQIDAKIREFANRSREIKADVEDINDATDAFNKAQKSFKEGLGESVKNFTSAATGLVNMINLQNIANNEYTKKANERYETMNRINATLGFQINEGKNAYSSIVSEFKDFNNNVGNLFNMDDLKSYIQQADSNGIHDQKLLQETLNQSMIANKYLGMSSETQNSLYKYMRLTNNNDAVSNYNKLMITLQKEHIGVSRDMLDSMIQQNVEVSDVLSAAGLSGDALKQFNSSRDILNAQISSKYGDEYGKQINEMVNAAVKNLATDTGRQQLAQQGINPWQLSSALSRGDASALYDMVITGMSRMGGKNFGSPLANMTYQNYLGLNAGDINAARKVGANGIDELGPVTQDILDKVKSMKDEDAENYVEQNTAISDLTRLSNKNNVWLEKTFGDSWFSYENMAKIFFAAAIAGNAFQIIGGIGKGIGGLVKFFGAGGGAKGLSSLLGLSGNGTTGTLSGLLGKAGPIAGAVGGVGVAIGALALATKAIASKNDKDLSNTNTAVSNLYEAYTQDGMDSISASVKAQDQAQTENKGGLWSNQYGSLMNFKDSNEVYSANNVGSIQSANLLNAFDWSDDREYFLSGHTSPFLTGSAEAKNALKAMIKSHDALGYNKIKAYALAKAIGSSGLNSYKRSQILAAIMAAALYQGRASDKDLIDAFADPKTFNFSQWQTTKDGIKNYIQKSDIGSIERMSQIFALLQAYDAHFMFKNGSFLGYPNNKEQLTQMISDFGLDGYHKAGLAYVPKENYRALLHQGEMVLNKEDAEAYRNAFGYGGSLNPKDKDYVGPHHGGYAGHQGIDLYFSKVGTPVGSAVAGTVVESRDIPVNWKDGKKYHGADSNGTHYSSYGRVVKVKGKENGKTYIYAHLNKRAVNTGDIVSAGTLLGWSGSTGNSSGPHLHFQVGSAYGEAAHAKYYTNYVRSANGAAAQTGFTGSTKTEENTITGNSSIRDERSGLAKVNTTGHRAIPGIGGAGNTPGNTTERIVNSIDGVSTKIIKYLDEIRKEQEDQRQLINAFSTSQQGIIDYR